MLTKTGRLAATTIGIVLGYETVVFYQVNHVGVISTAWLKRCRGVTVKID